MTTRRLARPLLAAALLALTGATQTLAVDSKDNAALGYWRAFSLMSPASIAFDSDMLTRSEFAIEDEFTRRLVQSPAIIDRLIEASAKPGCDFAIEFEKGPDALMPQLGPMRAAVRVLLLRSRMDLDNGAVDHATDCLVATLQSARHIVRDQVLISTLVGTMILSDAAPLIEYAVSNNLLRPADIARLREAVAAFSGPDALGAVAAMKQEHAMTGDWIRSLPPGRDSFKKLREFAGDAAAADRLEASLANDGDFRDGLPLYDMFMTRAIAALERRDGEEIQMLSEGMAAGTFGPLAQVVAPSFENILRSANRGDAILASLQKALAQ